MSETLRERVERLKGPTMEGSKYDREREAAEHRDKGDHAMAYNVLIEQGHALRARVAELEEDRMGFKKLVRIVRSTDASKMIVSSSEEKDPSWVIAVALDEDAARLQRWMKVTNALDLTPVAQCAYTAYGDSTGGKNHLGKPMPTWEDLPEKIREAWIAAAREVASLCVADLPGDGEATSET